MKGHFKPKNKEFGKKYLKFWSCMSSKGVGAIVFIDKPEPVVKKKKKANSKNGEKKWSKEAYLKILKENLMREGRRLCGEQFRLLQDGDSVHTSQLVTQWLVDNKVRPLDDWPASR
jgi:hypothetical protein